MELEQWNEFVTAADCGSLTGAAEKLGYTLSAVSRSISSLEKELGFILFYRWKKGIILTKEGEQLLPYAREILYAEEKAAQAAATIRGGEEGTIRIGTAYRHYYRWLTQVTSEYHALHPGVHFRIQNGTSTAFVDLLNQHAIDFCLISERAGTHEWYFIQKDRLIALLPADHVLAGQEEIPQKAFAEYPYIATCPGMDIDSARFFTKCGITPNMQFSSMDIQATYAMVDAGMGISITNQINSLTSYPGVCHREIEDTQRIEIGLACLKERPPVADGFLKFIANRLPGKDLWHLG